jgi:putative Holliday junction resolvase
VIGLDLGTRRIGVAVSDDEGRVATPYETIKRRGDEVVEHGRVAELVAEVTAVAVVVGHPIDLAGDRGPAARNVEDEVRRLGTKIEVPVHLHDERLTTVTADRSLRDQGVSRGRRTEVVDQLAAATMLQAWLDQRHR